MNITGESALNLIKKKEANFLALFYAVKNNKAKIKKIINSLEKMKKRNKTSKIER